MCLAYDSSPEPQAGLAPPVGLISSSSALRRDSSQFCRTVVGHGRRPPTAACTGDSDLTTLTETVDGVIGVDTHRDTLAAAAVTAIGATLGCTEAFADAGGYGDCFSSPTITCRTGAAGQSKEPAATAPDSPHS